MKDKNKVTYGIDFKVECPLCKEMIPEDNSDEEEPEEVVHETGLPVAFTNSETSREQESEQSK